MSKIFSSAVVVFLCLLLVRLSTFAQAPARPVVYSTPPKPVGARMKTNGHTLHGPAIFTITTANADDTVTGTLAWTLTEETRKKLAQVSGQSLTAIPAITIKKDLAAKFARGTACPAVHLEIGDLEIEVAGSIVEFRHLTLDILETPEEFPQLFCLWTRQINANRQRRGIIAAINRLLSEER